MPHSPLIRLEKFLRDRTSHVIKYNEAGNVVFSSPIYLDDNPYIADHVSLIIPPLNANIMVTAPKHTIMLTAAQAAALPESFTWQHTKDITPVYNQQTCGSCWAVSTVTTLNDRFVIQKKRQNPHLSPTFCLACDSSQSGCGGGSPQELAGKFLAITGTIHDDCGKGYSWCTKGTCNNSSLPSCDNLEKLANTLKYEGSSCLRFYKTKNTKSIYTTDPKMVTSIQNQAKAAIFEGGPIVAAMAVYLDFLKSPIGSDKKYWSNTGHVYINGQYDKGITFDPHQCHNAEAGLGTCTTASNAFMGFHAVTCVGWGVQKGVSVTVNGKKKTLNVPYWIIRNSWGPEWNGGGYFNIAMWDSTNRFNENVYIDLAKTISGQALGGFTSFDAGDISNKLQKMQVSMNGGPSSVIKGGRYTMVWVFLLIIIVAVAVGVGVGMLFSRRRRRRR